MCAIHLSDSVSMAEPRLKKRLLCMKVAHYRQPDVSEEDFIGGLLNSMLPARPSYMRRMGSRDIPS
jgi:hypothetical protein